MLCYCNYEVIAVTQGERIKQARLQRGLTQKELAGKLGVSESFISQYERDVRNPKQDTLQRIAVALDTTADALRGLKWELATPVDAESLEKHRKQLRQYSDLNDAIMEILRILYGTAQQEEVVYKGLHQIYYLVGETPHQHIISSWEMDGLVKSLPAFVERVMDPRPVKEVQAEMLDGLKSESEYMDNILGKE